MPVLQGAQDIYGYLPLEVQKHISLKMGVSMAEIYGIATFYSQFSLNPKGEVAIAVCLGTACYVKGSGEITDKISQILGIAPGETTADGMFTLDALRCIGACGIAPAVSINGKVYPKVEVSAIANIIEDLRAEGGQN